MMLIRLLIALLLSTCALQAAPLQLELASEGAILINAKTGAILFEKNSRKQFYPASTTKMATAWWALKMNKERLDEVITASQEAVASVSEEAIRRSNFTLPSWWIEQGSSHVGIKRGEELTLRDLLHGLMLRSGNDAANVIAQYVGGSIPNFLDDLNDAMEAIGMESTHFKNPHGLHHPRHLTTPYDLSLLARDALHDEAFREVVSAVTYTRPKTNKSDATTWVSSNQLLRKGKFYYPKAIGGKTGYHSLAKHNFIAAAEHNGRVLIAVLMKAPSRETIFKESKRLFEAAFNQPRVQKTLLEKGSQKFVLHVPGASKAIRTWAEDEVKIHYYPAEAPKLRCLLCWEELQPPIARGQQVGELRYTTPDGHVLKYVPLYAVEDVSMGWMHWFKTLLGY